MSSGVTEKLRLSHNNIAKSTHKLTQRLNNLSLSTLRFFKSLVTKTLTLFPSMDHFLFPSQDDDDDDDDDNNNNNHLYDPDYHTNRQPRSSRSSRDGDKRNHRRFDDVDDCEKLYLVPYRWWKEVQSDAGQTGGVLYNVLLKDDDADSEIVLDLRKEEGSGKCDDGEEGFSGREYALVSESMWLQTLKWHNDSKVAANNGSSLFLSEDHFQDLFPLKIRLSVMWETNSLVVKINLKDNVVDLYERACNIFRSRSELLHIWEFSGRITQFFVNEKITFPNKTPGLPTEEIILELQIYGFSDSVKGTDERNDEMAEQSKSGSVKMGSSGNENSCLILTNSQLSRGYTGIGFLGLTGLQNLGNTCFMNSAIQCLVHTPKLVDYFLGDYRKEINHKNSLGMNGEVALAFGDLLRKLWAPGATSVAPRMFKLKLAKFAPQFSGYNQHDSQEFLSFLLDGLHEDLNRVKCKPYVEVKDAEGRPDVVVAEEYWQNHLARNDSIIVDLFQGQYQSTLACPVCKKVSVTFDPFMYLSTPLPSTTMRTMTLTVLSTDGNKLPFPVTVTVPKWGRFKDLIEALSTECSLRNDEALLVVEIYRNSIFRFLEDPSDSLALIRDDDKLVAYRLLKDSETSPLVVFTHQQEENPYYFGRATSNWKMFGIPLVARLSNLSSGSDIREQFLKLLNPFLMPIEDASSDYDDAGDTANEDSVIDDAINSKVDGLDSETGDDLHESTDFQFYIVEDKKVSTEIKMNEPVLISVSTKILEVRVSWSENMIEKYDTCLLSSLPEVFKPQLFTRRPQESISLYKCLEAFLKEEPLGPEDMWYCPSCKKPRQASKRLDLWRLPEILVIHLKRFSYSRIITNKLETYVDFPIDDLDLSTYISHRNNQSSNRYMLYAISNHYGGMGGGHYTAFVDHGHGRWYEFDDHKVVPVSVDRIKTAAAYVLFYRRVSNM